VRCRGFRLHTLSPRPLLNVLLLAAGKGNARLSKRVTYRAAVNHQH
jgi:hypothetical protein